MSLKPLEILGAIAGFIPGVSTVTGLIKAFIYRRRAEGGGDKISMEKTTKKVSSNALLRLNLDSTECEYNTKLWKASIIEAIPGANFIAAIYSAVILQRLSKIRDISQDTDPNLKTQKKYLFELYKIKPAEDEKQRDCLGGVLMVLHNLDIQNIKGDQVKRSQFIIDQNFLSAYVLKKNLFAFCEGYTTNREAQSLNSVELVKKSLLSSIDDVKNQINSLESKLNENLQNLKKSSITPESVRQNLLNIKGELQGALNFQNAYLKELNRALASCRN